MEAVGVMTSGGLGLSMAAASIIADDMFGRLALTALRVGGVALMAASLALA